MIITFLPIALALPLCWCLQYLTSPNPPCGGAAGGDDDGSGGPGGGPDGPDDGPEGAGGNLGGAGDD